MSMPKVTYFNFAGSRGEEVRLALVIAGVAFDDNRVETDDFARIKAELPFGSLPIFEMPGRGVFAETNAILRLIGRLHRLHPDDPWDGARHDAVLEAGEELRQRLSATSRIADAAEKKAARQALAADYIPRWAMGIERLIGEGPFVGGARPAVADIKVYMIEKALSGGTYDDIPVSVLDPFGRLRAVARGIASHPAVLMWYAP
jgi:prostaglandin-H2 D-isomerase / glutathione transferase